MLELIDVKKDYAVAGGAVHALKGVSVKFRDSEFVSILGASGCGKTTLLNIIGGLDHYTSGDLIIEGRSTKQYKDGDWDTYRNHSIGFIFQSYHLIPHQTILQNVELALMISGVSKKERRQRAIEALDKVGLKDKINNRPNQLSGGQAQRVAIARALINDPEIVLADEPTGALDSVTSVQIMELLKEISKDRLVIMVTHNPELAEQYSTRIIRLLDGLVVDDSMPYDGEDNAEKPASGQDITAESAAAENGENNKDGKKVKEKKAAMSVGMAMGLSLKNLLSKRKRTAMVSVAGSIGIIGVSMVLAISAGVQGYINTMENDMLSGNPVAVTRSAMDFSSLMNMSATAKPKPDITKLDDKLYVKSLMETLGSFSGSFSKTNNITEAYIDYVNNIPEKDYNVIQYGYDFSVSNNLYTSFKVDDSGDGDKATAETSVTAIRGMYTQILSEQEEYKDFAGTVSTVATFEEMPNNYEYILSQYDVVAAETENGVVTDSSLLSEEQLKTILEDKQSLVMVVHDSEVTDLVMGQFGYLTQLEFMNYAFKAVGRDDYYDSDIGLVGSGGADDPAPEGQKGLDYTKFIGKDSKKFTWYSNDEVFVPLSEVLDNMRALGYNEAVLQPLAMGLAQGGIKYLYRPYMEENFFAVNMGDSEHPNVINLPLGDIKEDAGLELGVKIILQKKADISYGCLESGFYYTNALTDYVRQDSLKSKIVKDIGDGYLDRLPYCFHYTDLNHDENGNKIKTDKIGQSAIYDSGSILDMLISGLGGSGQEEMLRVYASLLGGSKLPSSIRIYPVDFNTKNSITDYLDGWNTLCEEGKEYTYTGADGAERTVTLEVKDKITYTDTVGLIINMVNTMIEMITIALVAFTALSLVVSTVMIGIITYVSVVERIKEIGILRAVGARKKDIKRLFNAETFIIGLAAGIFGIIVTYLLSLIINVIVLSLAGIWGIAALPWWQAGIMIALSVVLTLISGLIPASAAAKKDPVVALRTE